MRSITILEEMTEKRKKRAKGKSETKPGNPGGARETGMQGPKTYLKPIRDSWPNM
jgi:hypothetical protein